jgi:hypothetical protein
MSRVRPASGCADADLAGAALATAPGKTPHDKAHCIVCLAATAREDTVMSETPIPGNRPTLNELDSEIDAVRENIRELVEQAAAYSGAADDEQASTRIAEQEARLALLVKERDDRGRRTT